MRFCFEIVRVYEDDRPPVVLRSRVTEGEARAHCSRPETMGDGWMDVYRREEGR